MPGELSTAEAGRRLELLQAVIEAADEAPTVEDALRTALSRVCLHTGWRAARLHFTPEAGELAGRTFWHLEDASELARWRTLAEERRDSPVGGVLADVLSRGAPASRVLSGGHGEAQTVYAFPVYVRLRLFAVMEFFAAHAHEPDGPLVDTVAWLCAELGRILLRKPAEEELRRSEREHRELFEHGHDAILVVDPEDESILDANRRACELYGYPRNDLLVLPLSRLCAEPSNERRRLREVAAGRGSLQFESAHVRSDGSAVPVEISAGPVEYRGRRAVWMSNRNVSERRRVLEALRASEERYRLLFEASPQPMWVFDAQTLRFLAVNEATVRKYGYTREQFALMTLQEVRVDDDDSFTPGRLPGAGVPGGASLATHRLRDGQLIEVEVTSHELEFEGRPAWLVVASDVTERLRAERQLWQAAFYDALTGLPNRALFLERLKQAMDRAKGRRGSTFAVLFLDLDRFKVVNDSLGHRAGDQLLVQISRRLEGTRRAGDTVARLGGDEFAFLVEDVQDDHDAGRVADRVQRALAMPFVIDGQEVFTSASIGIAPGTQAPRPEDLLRDADTAMYRAKAQGIGQHAIFDITMHHHAVAALQLENDLRRAIERQELRVQYQPIVELATGRIAGFEALARWTHRQRGAVSPGEFIPMAEETGIITMLDEWVLKQACEHLRVLQLVHPAFANVSMSINLSGRDLHKHDLPDLIHDTAKASGVDPRSLRLEITESVLVKNEGAATRCLTRLRALGVQLCIDDFGTGYSSLSYLHRMPIDVLKIDASFVSGMATDDKNRKIVETILLLARNLGVDVIAEGVETPAQAALLQRLGCTHVQGFLYARPLDAEAACSLLASSQKPGLAQVIPISR